MTMSAAPSPHTTSHARMRSPLKWPSDPRRAERLRHHAVELAPAADIDRPRVGPKAVMMPASSRSLSSQSALVTWNGMRRLLAPRRAALELDVGLARGEAAGPDLDPLGVEGVRELRANRDVGDREPRRERSPHLAQPLLFARQLAGSDPAEHQVPRGRLDLRPGRCRAARPRTGRAATPCGCVPSRGR